jgi:peptidoglycan-associated lipoprotein
LDQSAKNVFASKALLPGIALMLGLSLGGCAGNPNAVDGSAAGAERTANAAGTASEFRSSVGDRIFFESDSAELTSAAQATLDRQALWLARHPRQQIKIEGHADERGTREYNFALGARRAEAAMSYLAARGIPSRRLRVVSYGKERPVSACDDISCWSQNRRAVTVLETGGRS